MAGSNKRGNGSTQLIIDRVAQVRAALLSLHRALIAYERIEYERLHGRVESSGEMLKLVTHDAWFAWLRPMSETIVLLDEFLDQDDDTAPEDGLAIIVQLRELIGASEESEFRLRYQAALQRDPDVVIEHGRLAKAMA